MPGRALAEGEQVQLGAISIDAAIPAIAMGATIATAFQVAPLRLPSCQKTIWSRAAGLATNVKNAMRPPAKALIATPVSTSVTTSVRPSERASR